MKHSFIRMLSLSLLFSGITWCYAQTPISINGQLKVVGTKLCNQYGTPIQLRGMSTHGIQWFGGCLTDASLDALAYDWGADILRISLYVQEGGYETDPAGYTAQVKQLITKATARGMYALIDWHILTPGDPNYNLSRAKTFFTDMANTYKNSTNVLYEVCNEPNGVSWASIKTYADQIIPVIRAIDSDAVICVGTKGWSSLGISEGSNAQDIVNNPVAFSNILYSFHFYAKSHQDLYLNELNWASDRLPIFVTEFGSQEASGDGANDLAMTQRYIDLMRSKKISWTGWNYSDHSYSGAVWQSGTCSNGPWTTARLKEAGIFMRDKVLNPADDFLPVGENIALGKSVTVSSTEEAAYAGAYAVDGNTATRWASVPGADPQWITVDLGDNYSISRIRINWEAAYGKNYLVQVSPDNSTWTTLKDVQNNTSVSNDLTSLSGTGRYVRIYGTARGTTYGYSIYELEVYGTLVSGAGNIALNKAVTVSSTEEAALAGNYAVDGNTTTRWASTLYVDPQWITIDLGDNYNVSRVKIVWEAAYAKNYLVQMSTDNSTWTTLKDVQNNTSVSNDHTGLSGTGRYVRIYGTARGTTYGYSIYELEVYGTLVSGSSSNIALNKTTTVSSTEEAGLEGSYAVDGNTTTRWASTLYVDPQWITVDLGTAYSISGVEVTWEAAYAKNYIVQLSSDNVTWTTLKDVQGNTSLTNNHTGLSGTGRYVRIYGTARGSEYGYSIYELEVYGTAAAGAATALRAEEQITVYPTPAEDHVTISIPEGQQRKSQVVLSDLNGKVYATETAEGNTHVLNISTIPSGMYFVQVISGKKKSVQRIWKK